jgi:translation initiation factor 2 subunit 1
VDHQEVLVETIKRKIASNPMKIRVDFALTCTQFDGIDVIREALLTAKHQVNNNDWKLEFKMIAPPNYQVEVQTHAKAEAEAKLKEALTIIKSVMKAKGGHFK